MISSIVAVDGIYRVGIVHQFHYMVVILAQDGTEFWSQ